MWVQVLMWVRMRRQIAMAVRMGLHQAKGMVVGISVQIQAGKGVAHHLGVQVATAAGVDLNGARTRGTNTVCVQRGLLVAFDHRHRQVFAARLQCSNGGAE